jgi:hypothetical protein
MFEVFGYECKKGDLDLDSIWSLKQENIGNWIILIRKFEKYAQILRSALTVYLFCVDLRTNSNYFTVQH